MKDNEPIKWKKHLILPFFGLRSMEKINSEIHRYKDIELMVRDIRNDIKQNNGQQKLYTISLVNRNQLHKLPNINIRNLEELEEFQKKLKEEKFDEFWYCRKIQDKNQGFSVGRISFDLRTQFSEKQALNTSQIIEQVWNSNHRKLEGVHTETAYLRASRTEWGRRYEVEQINIPEDTTISKEQMVEQFIRIVKEIEVNKERIEYLSNYLRKLGINQFSLEYLLEKDKFQFIDWDSQDDLKVINEIVKQER